MLNFTFNPINQVVVYLDACGPARVDLYRTDNTTRTSVAMTQHLRKLIRSAEERGQLEIEGSDTNYDSAPDVRLVYYMPDYVLDGFIAQYTDCDWWYLKQLSTIDDVVDEFNKMGFEDITEFECAQYTGAYVPIDTSEVDDAAEHPRNHHTVFVLTVVHGRSYLNCVIPFNVNGKLAAADLF